MKICRFPKFLLSSSLLALGALSSRAQTFQFPVAFVSDIHLQNVHGDFQTKNFQSPVNPKTGKEASIRTMSSQLQSTRLFNENYFAFIQTLEKLAAQKVKLVVLPGDFSDDGQPMNLQALQNILEKYRREYGMRFFLTTGNHDPVAPFGKDGGKSDYMGKGGQSIQIFSFPKSPEVFQSSEVRFGGYQDIFQYLAPHGFMPQEEDLFWTHPFQPFEYEKYRFSKAKTQAALSLRTFTDEQSQLQLPDASYLVEPVEGLWLLALDGNVFTYTGDLNTPDSTAWSGSSIGFNFAQDRKKHQLTWIKTIAEEAQKRGKTLISFSHYPLTDFHSGATEDMKELFGATKLQLNRVPERQTSEKYLQSGLQIHFAGHMHLNNTGAYQSSDGHRLLNIQVPSLAAFPPAYKLLIPKNDSLLSVQTRLMEEVEDFEEFFDLYRTEHYWLTQNQPKDIWGLDILNSKTYGEYTLFHLNELIRLRFLKEDWNKDLGLLVSRMTFDQLQAWTKKTPEEQEAILTSLLENEGLEGSFELIRDFYLLKNGGDLGKAYLESQKLEFYQHLEINPTHSNPRSAEFWKFLSILQQISRGLPSEDFDIDLHSLQVIMP